MKVVGGNKPEVLSATTMINDLVVNPSGKKLGKIEELMIDVERGRIAYAVLSFGSMEGMEKKFFAIPWDAFTLDADREVFILDVDEAKLRQAPGFAEQEWPEAPMSRWLEEVYSFYGTHPYWE